MKPLTRRVLAPVLAGLLAAAAFGAEDDRVVYPGKSAPSAAPTTAGALGNTSLILGAALAAVGGWLVWRGRRQGLRPVATPALAIAESRSLGNRQFLVVAAYEEKKFLLGVCPGRIELLARLHDEKAGP